MVRLPAPVTVSLVMLAAIALAAVALGEGSGEIILVVLFMAALLLPGLALFARNWWASTLIGAVCGSALFIAALAAVSASGAAESMGPAGMAYMAPMLLYPAAVVASGILRLVVQIARHASGARGEAPFVSQSLKAGLAAAALGLLVAGAIGIGGGIYSDWRDQRARAGAGPLPAEALVAWSGTAEVHSGQAIIQIWNKTGYRLTSADIEIDPGTGAAPTRRQETFPAAVHPGNFFFLYVDVDAGATTPVVWRVTAASGYRLR